MISPKQAQEITALVQELSVDSLVKIKQHCGIVDDQAVDPQRLMAAAVASIMLVAHIETLVRQAFPKEWRGGIRAFVDKMSTETETFLNSQLKENGDE